MSEQIPDKLWIGYDGKDFTVSATRQSLRVPYVTECSVEMEKQKARGEAFEEIYRRMLNTPVDAWYHSILSFVSNNMNRSSGKGGEEYVG